MLVAVPSLVLHRGNSIGYAQLMLLQQLQRDMEVSRENKKHRVEKREGRVCTEE